MPATVIPDGQYFVMGDNRGNSLDSRNLGPIPKDLIIGKAMLAYWPPEDFGLAPNGSPKIRTDMPLSAARPQQSPDAVRSETP
jgi:hypothetical protein